MGGAVFPPGSLTYGRDNDDLQKDLCLNPCIQYSGHASMGDSWTLTGKSGSVSCGVTAPFSWVLVSTRTFVCAFQESVSPVVWKFYNQIPLASKVKFPGGSQFLCRISTLGNLLWTIELSEQCKSFFAIIVLQFVGCLLSGSVVGLIHPTFIGRTDAEAAAPILGPPGVKNWHVGKDPDAGKDWRKEKGRTEDKMVGWHQQLDGQWVWASSGSWW